MNIYLCFLIAVFTAISVLIIKRKNPEIALLLSVAGVVLIFSIGISYISQSINSLKTFEILDYEFIEIPLKLLGLTILSKITASICEDAGEKGLAVSVQTISRFASVGIAFPLFEELIEQIKVALLL